MDGDGRLKRHAAWDLLDQTALAGLGRVRLLKLTKEGTDLLVLILEHHDGIS